MTYKKENKELRTKLDLAKNDKAEIITLNATNMKCANFYPILDFTQNQQAGMKKQKPKSYYGASQALLLAMLNG